MAGSILLFGKIRDAFGASCIPLPDGVSTAADLRARLVADNPDLAAMLSARSVRIAVNQSLIGDEAAQPVGASDEIALLPPLSGG